MGRFSSYPGLGPGISVARGAELIHRVAAMPRYLRRPFVYILVVMTTTNPVDSARRIPAVQYAYRLQCELVTQAGADAFLQMEWTAFQEGSSGGGVVNSPILRPILASHVPRFLEELRHVDYVVAVDERSMSTETVQVFGDGSGWITIESNELTAKILSEWREILTEFYDGNLCYFRDDSSSTEDGGQVEFGLYPNISIADLSRRMGLELHNLDCMERAEAILEEEKRKVKHRNLEDKEGASTNTNESEDGSPTDSHDSTSDLESLLSNSPHGLLDSSDAVHRLLGLLSSSIHSLRELYQFICGVRDAGNVLLPYPRWFAGRLGNAEMSLVSETGWSVVEILRRRQPFMKPGRELDLVKQLVSRWEKLSDATIDALRPSPLSAQHWLCVVCRSTNSDTARRCITCLMRREDGWIVSDRDGSLEQREGGWESGGTIDRRLARERIASAEQLSVLKFSSLCGTPLVPLVTSDSDGPLSTFHSMARTMTTDTIESLTQSSSYESNAMPLEDLQELSKLRISPSEVASRPSTPLRGEVPPRDPNFDFSSSGLFSEKYSSSIGVSLSRRTVQSPVGTPIGRTRSPSTYTLREIHTSRRDQLRSTDSTVVGSWPGPSTLEGFLTHFQSDISEFGDSPGMKSSVRTGAQDISSSLDSMKKDSQQANQGVYQMF